MTIESASFPEDLSTWSPDEHPFYLELFGETSPTLDIHYAEASSSSPDEAGNPIRKGAPIYEYFWTLGHPGLPRTEGGPLSFLHGDEEGHHPTAEALWGHLRDDPAARVYVYFPLGGGWRVKELVATVKYLSPIRDEHSLMEQAAKDWQQIQPAIATASQVAGLASPLIGPVGVGAASALSAIAKVKMTSVPQAKGFEWSAAKVTFPSDSGPMQGFMWDLPRRMFELLGGRLGGSVAVSFIPDARQRPGVVATGRPAPELKSILCHASVRGPEDHWAPAKNQFVELAVAPQYPPEAGRKP
jgi:hypothetical protein